MGEIYGFLPTIVMNEVLHRFMIAELIENGIGRNPGDVINKVKNLNSRMQTVPPAPARLSLPTLSQIPRSA